jgi:hypothetical protein
MYFGIAHRDNRQAAQPSANPPPVKIVISSTQPIHVKRECATANSLLDMSHQLSDFRDSLNLLYRPIATAGRHAIVETDQIPESVLQDGFVGSHLDVYTNVQIADSF